MTRKHLFRLAAIGTSFAPALATAHPGHGADESFVAGALHSLSSIDHLAGFVLTGAILVAAAMMAIRAATRFSGSTTAGAPRSRILAASAAPAHRPSSSR